MNPVSFLLIIFLGCSEKKPKQPEMLPQDEIPEYREAIKKMAQYIILEDSAYHFIISKEKVLEKGIPEKQRMQYPNEYDCILLDKIFCFGEKFKFIY